MSNPNFANISFFQSLQQHSGYPRAGQSHMSVFNATYQETRQPANTEEQNRINSLKGEIEEIEKDYSRLATSHQNAIKSREQQIKELKSNTAAFVEQAKKDGAEYGAYVEENKNIITKLNEQTSQVHADMEELRGQKIAAIKPKMQELEKLGVIVTGTEMR